MSEFFFDQKNSQNSISRDNCVGFDENSVLAVKDCFYEVDIRCLLIKEVADGLFVRYFSRFCSNTAADDREVCDECSHWFNKLSDRTNSSESFIISECSSSFESEENDQTQTSLSTKTELTGENDDDIGMDASD